VGAVMPMGGSLGVEKNLGGRPPHAPTDQTRATVNALAAYGVPQPQIALFIGISDETLRKYYRREFDLGMIEANAKVAEALFRQATEEGNTAAAIWWTKVRMGWRERTGTEHSGSLSLSVTERLDIAVMKAADSTQVKAAE
jgi:hypothetical protein